MPLQHLPFMSYMRGVEREAGRSSVLREWIIEHNDDAWIQKEKVWRRGCELPCGWRGPTDAGKLDYGMKDAYVIRPPPPSIPPVMKGVNELRRRTYSKHKSAVNGCDKWFNSQWMKRIKGRNEPPVISLTESIYSEQWKHEPVLLVFYYYHNYYYYVFISFMWTFLLLILYIFKKV